jgi:hypothetical protein
MTRLLCRGCVVRLFSCAQPRLARAPLSGGFFLAPLQNRQRPVDANLKILWRDAMSQREIVELIAR